MKKIILAALSILMILTFASCGKDGGSTETQKESEKMDFNGENVKVEMKIKDFGTVKLELYPDVAPITVANFVKLVESGFYDGLTFHRIFPGFMIQGGDPEGNGSGGTDTIKGEFAANGVKNDLSHTRGVISMARLATDYDSASCQFFIMHADYTSLDGQYAAFGEVVEGRETVDEIAAARTDAMDKPFTPQVMKEVYFVVKG